jgi:dTDP-4-amino-4,6-dideoxygalactose transaminase
MRIPYHFPYPTPAPLVRDVAEVLEARIHYLGARTQSLEEKLARLCGVAYVSVVGSGSAAVLLALHACAVDRDDEIVMPANIYGGVPEAALLLGARPVFVDVEDDTANIDVSRIEDAITPRTRAIAVQHTYGHPADMAPVLEIAGRRGLRVIEDAAHALGGAYAGQPVGGIGDVGVFAFSNKGISACGPGGAVVTRHESLAEDVRARRYHGRIGSYETRVLGYNFRLAEMVAAVAAWQMDFLEGWNAHRRENAARYSQTLATAAMPVRPQGLRPYAHHTYLHYVVRAGDRDRLRRHLAAAGIDARVHYEWPAHLHRGFAGRLAYRSGDFPVAEAICRECLSLPAHPGVGPAEVDEIVERIRTFYR